MVGKYMDLQDSYLSVNESLVHGGIRNDCEVKVVHIDAEDIEKEGPDALLGNLNGILVPGGFGDRGTEGKIIASRYAREHNLPYFGLCLGMQIAVIDFARNVLGLEKANSEEFDPKTPDPVIHIMDEQKSVEDKGATMRLGACPCVLKKGSAAFNAYGKDEVSERHRHRFEYNNMYRQKLEEEGLIVSGTNPECDLVEIVEVKNHPWYVGVQFHPEFQSKPNKAHPLFAAFIEASLTHRLANLKEGKNTQT
jgi:CTP synthase